MSCAGYKADNLTPEQMARLDAVNAIPPIFPYWDREILLRTQSVSDGVNGQVENGKGGG